MPAYRVQQWSFPRPASIQAFAEIVPFRMHTFVLDTRSNPSYASGTEYRLTSLFLDSDIAANYEIRWTLAWRKTDGSNTFYEDSEVIASSSTATSWREFPVTPPGFAPGDFFVLGPNDRSIPILGDFRSLGADIFAAATEPGVGTAANVIQKCGFVGYDGTGFFRKETVTPASGAPWAQEFSAPAESVYSTSSFAIPRAALYHVAAGPTFGLGIGDQGRDTGHSAGELGRALGYEGFPLPVSFRDITQTTRAASDGSTCELSEPLSDSDFEDAVDDWIDTNPGTISFGGAASPIGARLSTFRRYFLSGGILWAYARQQGRIVLGLGGLPAIPYTLTMRHRYVPFDGSGDGSDTDTDFVFTPNPMASHSEDIPDPADSDGAEVLMDLLAPEDDAWWFQDAPVAYAQF